MEYRGIRGTIITAEECGKLNIREDHVIIIDASGTIQGIFEYNRCRKCIKIQQ